VWGAAPVATYSNKVKQIKHTFTTYVYNQCNICNIQIKHSLHTSETDEAFGTYTYNICVKTYTTSR
jgi:hypothetical protein